MTEHAKFLVPDFDYLTVAFGADEKDYLTREQMGSEFYNGSNEFCKIANSLFFKGGKIADYGIQFKSEIDHQKAMKAIRVFLRSWAPKHEIKIGTVGYALSQWCEKTP